MGFVYINIVLWVIAFIILYFIFHPHKISIPKIRKRKSIKQSGDIKQVRAEIDDLKSAVNELHEDMKHLQEVNNETQKRNELLFPQNFDKDKVEGKTVFVKDGEEKPYETVDWRSR